MLHRPDTRIRRPYPPRSSRLPASMRNSAQPLHNNNEYNHYNHLYSATNDKNEKCDCDDDDDDENSMKKNVKTNSGALSY